MTQEFQRQLEIILSTALNIFQVIATFLIAFLVVLWMTLCFWTFRDIQSRTRDIIAQVFATLLVFFFNIPGVLLYILVRPKETLVQAYERSLQEEYMLQDLEEREICPTCRVKTQPDFLFCFNCRTRIRRECGACGQLVKLKWASCPFCGTPQKTRQREERPGLAGLGVPRPASRQPQPATTALATTAPPANGNGLAPSQYQPAAQPQPYPTTPVVPPQAYQPQGYADGGENYNYVPEPVYTYRPENDHALRSNGGNTTEEAPPLENPAGSSSPSVEQPTQRFHIPRHSQHKNGNPARPASPDQADSEASSEHPLD